MNVRLDDAPEHVGPTLALSLALGQREGNFLVAPDALLDDGLFDHLHVGNLTRLSVLGFAPGLVTGKLSAHPEIRRGRCRQAHVRSETPLVVHVDGEFFSLPDDGVRELDVQLLPGALRVWGWTGAKQ